MMICGREGELLRWKPTKHFRLYYLIVTGHFTFRPMRLFTKNIILLFAKQWKNIRMIARLMVCFSITNIFMARFIFLGGGWGWEEREIAFFGIIKKKNKNYITKKKKKNIIIKKNSSFSSIVYQDISL